MTLREQYEKETGQDVLIPNELDGTDYNPNYTWWLESKVLHPSMNKYGELILDALEQSVPCPPDYPELKDGETIRVDMDEQVLYFACCDCGLVHTFEFSHIKDGKWNFIVSRNEKETRDLTDDNIKDKATAFADWLSDNGYWKHCDEEEWYYQLDKGEVKLDELWDRYLSEKMAEKVIQMKKPISRKEEG